MIRLFYKLFKRQILAIYSTEQSPRLDHAQLEKRLVDSNGLQYYGFGNGVALPVERFGKLMEFMGYMAAGISGEELETIIDAGEKQLEEGLKKGKAASKIGFLFQAIKERKDMVLHTELMYNYLAIQLVREDEAPDVYNPARQAQKVDQFKLETKNGNSFFFFQQPELKRLNELLNLSEQEWAIFWEESKVKQEALQNMIEKYINSTLL